MLLTRHNIICSRWDLSYTYSFLYEIFRILGTKSVVDSFGTLSTIPSRYDMIYRNSRKYKFTENRDRRRVQAHTYIYIYPHREQRKYLGAPEAM